VLRPVREPRDRDREATVSDPVTEVVGITAVVRRLALRPEEAASALGVSRDHFDKYIAPEVRSVARGRIRLYPVAALEKWLDREAARIIDR
jgi:hypothetical protein